MSARSERTLAGVPTKPYDLLLEGLLVLALVLTLVVVLAALFGSPDYPTVRASEVARDQPVAFERTAARMLVGSSDLNGYGPPYTANAAGAQRILGIAPATWFGVSNPIHPARDLVLAPLERSATLDPSLAAPLASYRGAPPAQQRAWSRAYLKALGHARVENGKVTVPPGSYGPVPKLMDGMLRLGRSGLLAGALEANAQQPYALTMSRALLFFQGSVDHAVARSLNMVGETWGISHETGPYPGAWWLWPYTFLYQVPPMVNSPNGDLQVVAIVLVALVLLPLFLPFVPVLNRIPRWIPLYRWIWRSWYARGRSSRA
jgi:hypothetical protein